MKLRGMQQKSEVVVLIRIARNPKNVFIGALFVVVEKSTLWELFKALALQTHFNTNDDLSQYFCVSLVSKVLKYLIIFFSCIRHSILNKLMEMSFV